MRARKNSLDTENVAQAEARGRQCATRKGAPESENPYRKTSLRNAFKSGYFAELMRIQKGGRDADV